MKGRIVSLAGLGLALLSAATAVTGALGTRAEWWNFRVGFQVLTWAAYGGFASVLVTFLGGAMAMWRRQGRLATVAAVGLIIGFMVAGIPWRMKNMAQRVPPIHDITTDTDDPPGFIAILPFRLNAPNSVEYEGPSIAVQQNRAYPAIKPLVLQVSVETAFQRALTVARALGWEIVAEDLPGGRIEATDTTLWFGFKDDIVVRLRATSGGTRVDVRSVSRVGKSDVGTNANRIATFLGKLASSFENS